jgi:hypothetical protein
MFAQRLLVPRTGSPVSTPDSIATPRDVPPDARRVGAPASALPYDVARAPSGPDGLAGWSACHGFLHELSGHGVPSADTFVMQHRTLKYGDVHRFFGALAPDPMLGAHDSARLQRTALGLPDQLPATLAVALREIVALPPDHASQPLHQLAEYLQRELRLCGQCDAPQLPSWADRSRILQGQRAFMTRLLPSVLVLVCKSLPEAYSAARPASVLNLSGELAALPYHRLLGTLQLLVTVSTPHSFEGPWYPAFVAAQEMQLLHAGVRMNVAPRLVDAKRGRIERDATEWIGRDDYALWGGYDAFRRGWPVSDGAPETACDPPQVVVSQTDMLATIIAFSLLVVDGLKTLGVPMRDDDAEAFWHLWRVFAVLKGLHPPGQPDDGSWVPATLAEARAFWQVYRSQYLTGPTRWQGDWEREAREQNPAGYALTSAHLRMLAKLLRAELRLVPIGEAQWLHVVRYYVTRLCGEEGAARVGVPRAPYKWLLRTLLETVPRWWARTWDRVDVELHVATSRRVLNALIGQVYGERVVFPIPQTADELKAFVEQSSRTRPVAKALERL